MQYILTNFDFEIELDFYLMRLLPDTVNVNLNKIGAFTLLNENFVH